MQKGMIFMTSNAKELTVRERREQSITHTVHTAGRRESRRKSLAAQKLAGAAVLLIALLNPSAAFVMAPLALAAMFSKEKFLDFNIFGSPVKQQEDKLRSIS